MLKISSVFAGSVLAFGLLNCGPEGGSEASNTRLSVLSTLEPSVTEKCESLCDNSANAEVCDETQKEECITECENHVKDLPEECAECLLENSTGLHEHNCDGGTNGGTTDGSATTGATTAGGTTEGGTTSATTAGGTTGATTEGGTTGVTTAGGTTGAIADGITTGGEANHVTTGGEGNAVTTGGDANAVTTGGDAYGVTTGGATYGGSSGGATTEGGSTGATTEGGTTGGNGCGECSCGSAVWAAPDDTRCTQQCVQPEPVQ